jgi:hypothetical protein
MCAATKQRLVKTDKALCVLQLQLIFGVCNAVRLLQLLIATIRKWSINQISNLKPRRESLIHVTIFSNRHLIIFFTRKSYIDTEGRATVLRPLCQSARVSAVRSARCAHVLTR